MRSIPRALVPLLVLTVLLTVASTPAALSAQDGSLPFEYDYVAEEAIATGIDVDNPDPDQLREIFAKRRARVLDAMPDGAMIIFSVERAQERRLEFQVPHSDNHDFIYLTGLEGLDSLDSALVLVPPPGEQVSEQEVPNVPWTVLYTSGHPETIASRTGIDDVRAFDELEKDLSVAMTDYRDWRVTQVRRWPLAAALSKRWGPDNKVLYLNYPRFFRLGMPEPARLETFAQIERFSPEIALRDSADILDIVRMYHDSWSLANLRRAIDITSEGVIEALRIARTGLTEMQVMEAMDFVYRYRGAYLGFPTSVRRQFFGGEAVTREVPEGWIEFVPRSGGAVFEDGDLLHTDTGAAFNHYSADVQRVIPINGTFTDAQRELYEIALDVQTTVIEAVRPGVTWWELHELAVQMLRDAGGYDEHYTYGIGHFIGMEVHDEGDYLRPLAPGMMLSIEQGVMPPNGPRVAFEDDVLVTEDGFEWLSRTIPIEIAEIEELARQEGTLQPFIDKTPFDGLLRQR
ncbi:MAG: M24 family metallopeptidase [Acidobacteria bacterium]|nr:M24 family metallopeptidase [Acidobacteriota bacterium]